MRPLKLLFTVGSMAVVLAAVPAQAANRPKEAPAAGRVEIPKKIRVLYAPRPVYPYIARYQRWEGKGLFILYVRTDGTVSAVGVLESTGFKMLDMAGAAAFIKWRFPPRSISRVRIPLRFTMRPRTRFW